MKRTALIVISILALAGLVLVAVQCDGGTAPVPTKPPVTTPAAPGTPAPTTPGGAYPPGETPSPAAYPPGTAEATIPASPTVESYPIGGTPGGTPQGEELLNTRCKDVCHNLDRVKSAKKTADDWRITVTKMRGKGATLNDVEATILIEYLAATYK